jgi:hypothetical protein
MGWDEFAGAAMTDEASGYEESRSDSLGRIGCADSPGST